MSLVIGIDPGLRYTGWGIVSIDKSVLSYIASGVIKNTLATEEISVRLGIIFKELTGILKRYQPVEAAIENIYVNTNFKTSISLAQARAAAMIACDYMQIRIVEYQAKTVKKVITGSGNSDKEQVLQMLGFYLPNIKSQIKTNKTHDETDAIAIAVCHSLHYNKKIEK